MKIQLASDLHLEFIQRNFPGEHLIAPAHGADLLVLAGDIANSTQPPMTMPFERTRALLYAGELLAELLDPVKTSDVPDVVRGRARHALRHYPSRYEISVIAEQAALGAQINPMLDAVVTRGRL